MFESGPPIAHVAADPSIHPETLRKRVRQAEADAGPRNELLSSEEREELKRLRGEVRELRRANEILKSSSHAGFDGDSKQDSVACAVRCASCAALTRSSSQRASRRRQASHPGVLAVQRCAALLLSREAVA